MKHTPGPWEYFDIPEDKNGNMGYYAICTKEKVNKLSGEFFHLAKTYKEANAKLIAAAPMLLEALQQLVSRINHNAVNFDELPEVMQNELINNARKAIAAATDGCVDEG